MIRSKKNNDDIIVPFRRVVTVNLIKSLVLDVRISCFDMRDGLLATCTGMMVTLWDIEFLELKSQFGRISGGLTTMFNTRSS
jgi:hypothetical protein